jgi:dTDP-4-amino-4,6-dideoxygalactose transaminase
VNGLPPPWSDRPTREIGSFFAALNENLLTQSPQQVPWADGIRPEYLETGRQALNAIARNLLNRGVKLVFLPEYLCESILEPFLVNSLAVSFLPMTDGLQIDLRALERLGQQTAGKQSAVLMVRYFGHARDDDYIRQIARLQNLGNIVVEDLTHSLFDVTRSTADYTFASLRKLLPVASGAMVTGIDSHTWPVRSELADELWMHMDSKKEYLNGGNINRSFYKGLLSASGVLEGTLEPHRMDGRSFELLEYLPYGRFIQSRRHNFAALTEQLASVRDISILNQENTSIATHLVLRTSDSSGVRQKLAERGIYCPMHWPRPDGLPAQVPWKDGHFSIPIDHRYSTDDMMYAGSSIREILS